MMCAITQSLSSKIHHRQAATVAIKEPIGLQAYVRKQAQCLLDVEGNIDSNNPSLGDLHQWGLEAQAVLICFSMCNPNNIGIVHSLNMKDGLFQEPPPEHGPADLLVRCAYDSHESRRSTHKHYWQKIVCLVLVVAVTDRDDLMSANTTSKGNLDSTHCYCMSPGHHLLPPDNAVMPNSVTV